MPIHGYPGNVITANPTAPTSSVASGVWTTEQQLLAQAAGNWPLPGPPQPISRSLRFNTNDSTYLSRSPASAGNQKTWTWSTWVKPSRFASQQPLFNSYSSATNYGLISFSASGYIDANDTLKFIVVVSNSQQLNFQTSALYRDPSAWYHIVIALDTTQATNTNRVKIYVNGVQVTAFSTATYPTQNLDVGLFNTTNQHQIGALATGTYGFFSGYMTEMYFINGQQLTPSSFGQTNTSTGVWEPIAYTGTYGTNGFYLNFSDNSGTTSTTLGKDYSGNGNNWTPNNFSVTAGAGNDSLVDTPTSYGTDTGVGGEVRGNYCTMNPLNAFGFASGAIANGNLDVGNGNGSVYAGITSTMRIPTTVPIYAEFTVTSLGSTGPTIGITSNSTVSNTAGRTFGDSANDWVLLTSSGNKENNNSSTSYGTGFSANDIGMLAVDTANGKVWFGKNGTWFNSGVPASGTNAAFTNVSGEVYIGEENDSDDSAVWNFGQRAFAYTAPSGFKALCTQNLPTPTIGATSTTQAGKYFNPILWTATDAASRALTGVGFQPDFLWAKTRNTAGVSHRLYDAVRGATNGSLVTDSSAAQDTTAGQLTSFDTDGFTTGTNKDYLNYGSRTYVGWCWKANGAGSSNTAGTITSTVSASTTSGFSIVTYTGNGTSGATIGHGLGVAPSMIIVKMRSGIQNWVVYHTSLGNTKALFLDLTAAAATNSLYWNNTSPTSSLITLGSGNGTNASGSTYVHYCFAPVAGYSAFGSYTGNGSTDGPFVYTGFRPRYIVIKMSSGVEDWRVFDTARSTYNIQGATLYPNTSSAENSSQLLDINSNGFKCRTSDIAVNGSGSTYIYFSFAENPFKYSLAR